MRKAKLLSVITLGTIVNVVALQSTGVSEMKSPSPEIIEQAINAHPVASKKLANKKELAQEICDLQAKYASIGITAAVILGMIEAESTFEANAVGYADKKPMSYGLMQITPRAAQTIIKENYSNKLLLDPIINVRTGVAYLAGVARRAQELGIKQHNLLDYTMGMYNMGERGFMRTLTNNKPGKVASNYINKQTKFRSRWEQLLKEKGGD